MALRHQFLELAVGDLVGLSGVGGLPAVGGQVIEHHCQHHRPAQEDQQAVEILFVFIIIPVLIVVHYVLLLSKQFH